MSHKLSQFGRTYPKGNKNRVSKVNLRKDPDGHLRERLEVNIDRASRQWVLVETFKTGKSASDIVNAILREKIEGEKRGAKSTDSGA